MCVCIRTFAIRMARIGNMNFIFLLRICCNSGDLSSIPGSGRSAGKGIGDPLLYSGLENFMSCIAHGVTKNQR